MIGDRLAAAVTGSSAESPREKATDVSVGEDPDQSLVVDDEQQRASRLVHPIHRESDVIVGTNGQLEESLAAEGDQLHAISSGSPRKCGSGSANRFGSRNVDQSSDFSATMTRSRPRPSP